MADDDLRSRIGFAKLAALLNAPGMPAPRMAAAARVAAEYELTRHAGLAAGLTDEAVREVVDAWIVWHRGTPWPLSWTRVRAAVVARAAGAEWRPGQPGAVRYSVLAEAVEHRALDVAARFTGQMEAVQRMRPSIRPDLERLCTSALALGEVAGCCRFRIDSYAPAARRVFPFYWRAFIETRWSALGGNGFPDGVENGGTRVRDVGWAVSRWGALVVAQREMARLGMPEAPLGPAS